MPLRTATPMARPTRDRRRRLRRRTRPALSRTRTSSVFSSMSSRFGTRRNILLPTIAATRALNISILPARRRWGLQRLHAYRRCRPRRVFTRVGLVRPARRIGRAWDFGYKTARPISLRWLLTFPSLTGELKLPDRRQRLCKVSATLQCGIMKVEPCRRGPFQGRLTWVREG